MVKPVLDVKVILHLKTSDTTHPLLPCVSKVFTTETEAYQITLLSGDVLCTFTIIIVSLK